MKTSSLGLATLGVALIASLAWAAPPESSTAPAGWLGVRLESTSGAEGVAVTLIMEDSPAHQAGLRARDVILAVDGQAITSTPELIQAIQGQVPGSWVSLSVARAGEPWDLRLRLGERPADIGRVRFLRGWIGVEAIDLPAALREHFGAPENAGVMISSVVEGSPAHAAGVELGDVIFEVDERRVGSPGQLASLLAGSGIGNAVELRLAREGLEVVLEAVVEAAPAGSDD